MQMSEASHLFDALEVAKLADEPVRRDRSAQNRSSIAVLLQYDGTRILLAGDLPDDELVAAIRELLQQTGEQPLRLDAMLVPHHGSRTSMSRQLLELIDCRRFLVSTDGSKFEHPDPESIARIVTNTASPTELMFNHRTPQTIIWDDPELRERFGYTTTFPTDPAGGLVVDLLAPLAPVEPTV